MRVMSEYAAKVCKKWQEDQESLRVTMETQGQLSMKLAFTGTISEAAGGFVVIVRDDDTFMSLDVGRAAGFDFADECEPPDEEPPVIAGRPFKGCLSVFGAGGQWFCQIERKE